MLPLFFVTPAITQAIATQTPPALALVTNEGDTRLNTKVSVKCKRLPLSDVLQTLQAESGVALKVEDKRVAKRLASVLTTQLPLYRILSNISKVCNLTWVVREVNGEKQYLLHESAKNRKYVRDLNDAGLESVLQKIRLARQYLRLSKEEITKRAQTGDSIAQDFLKYDFARDEIALLTLLNEDGIAQLRDHETIVLTYDQLSQEARQGLESYCRYDYEKTKRSVETANNNVDFVSKYGILPEPKLQLPKQDSLTLRYTADGEGLSTKVQMFYQDGLHTIEMTYPYTTDTPDTLWFPQMEARAKRNLRKEYSAEHVKIREDSQTSGEDFGMFLAQLHEQTRLNLFADAYPASTHFDLVKTGLTFSYDEGTRLSSILGGCGIWQRNYWQEGASGKEVLFLRKDWYLLQDDSKAESLLARLQAKRDRTQPFTLEDYAELSLLPAAQRERVASPLKVEKSYVGVLKFYITLTSAEKRLLCGQGLTRATLPSSKWRGFEGIMRLWNITRTDTALQTARLKLNASMQRSFFIAELVQADGSITEKQLFYLDGLPAEQTSKRNK
ncbi:MAG: hypothetical protein NT023_06865 [Armatimonadetes bacterium]|nr:hypothetical protein [Armatimonadota bacterium]